jgi:hypothetical protein
VHQQIGDREIAGTEIRDIEDRKTPKPETKSGKLTVKCGRAVWVNKGPVDRVFNRDSSRESEEPLWLMK